MAEAPIRVGLVGCGRIGAQTRQELRDRLGRNWLPLSHADAIGEISDFALVACCDTDREAAAAAAARHGAGLVYTDYATMLKEAELEVLCVATRGDVRPEILCAAAQAGIRAVHCEKPLAQSVALASKVACALDEAKVAFSYGTLRTYMPVYQRARTIGQGNGLGTLQSVTAKFGRSGLLWHHPHSVGLLCQLSGDGQPEFVQATLKSVDGALSNSLIDSDPLVLSALIEFSNGVTGHIIGQGGSSVELAGTTGWLSVVGNGSWILQGDFSAGVQCDPPRTWSFVKDDTEVSGRVRALRELRDALRLGKPTTLSAADALLQQRTLFAMAQSDIEGGRRIRVDEVDPDLVITGRTHGRVA